MGSYDDVGRFDVAVRYPMCGGVRQRRSGLEDIVDSFRKSEYAVRPNIVSKINALNVLKRDIRNPIDITEEIDLRNIFVI